MADLNTNYEEVVVENSEVMEPKTKRDYSTAVGAGALVVGGAVVFEGGKWLFKKAKKAINKTAEKIVEKREAVESESGGNEPVEETNE